MATTMSLISKQTLGSSATSVTFSNIPQTYTDLRIVASVRTTGAVNFDILNMQFNGDTGNNYSSRVEIYGYNGSAGSNAASTKDVINIGYINGNSSTASTFCNAKVDIPNYALTGRKKITATDIVEEINSSSNYLLGLNSSTWNNTTDAITSIRFLINSGDPMAQYSTFYLYGISNSSTQNTSVPYALGGDIIKTDGTYWYHTFLNSGTFTPIKALTADYLVVAGGGGGGGGSQPGAGGGGAGGYRTSIGGTALSLTSGTAYATIVGAGGAAGTSSSGTGTNGGNSIFSTITSAGGGCGAGSVNTDTVTSGSGGSGGGGSRPASGNTTMPGGSGNTPSTSPSQGNNGGNGYHRAGISSNGGGGGGASAAGQNAGDVSRGGDGGAGTANSISGSSVTYAGGGGGGSDTGNNGAGGAGGGGAGANTGVAGTANLGGGGGGSANYNSSGGNGGSGVVIIRYAVA